MRAMRSRTSPMEHWMAERSSGRGAEVAGVLDRAAGGVVVVAELLVAQAWAAAAVAVGEDVAALVAFGRVVHGGIPPVYR